MLAAIAASFGLDPALHAGLIVHLSGTRLAEPVIVPAALLIGIAGVLLGMTTLDLRPRLRPRLGPRTESNDLYHVAVLALMLLTHPWYRRTTCSLGRT